MVINNVQQARDRMERLTVFGKATSASAEHYSLSINQYYNAATSEQQRAVNRYTAWLRGCCNGLARQGQTPGRSIETVQTIEVIGEEMTLSLMRHGMANAKGQEARNEWNELKERWNISDK